MLWVLKRTVPMLFYTQKFCLSKPMKVFYFDTYKITCRLFIVISRVIRYIGSVLFFLLGPGMLPIGGTFRSVAENLDRFLNTLLYIYL